MSHDRDEGRPSPATSRGPGQSPTEPELGRAGLARPVGLVGPGRGAAGTRQTAPGQPQARAGRRSDGPARPAGWPGTGRASGTGRLRSGRPGCSASATSSSTRWSGCRPTSRTTGSASSPAAGDAENAAASLVKKLLPVLDTADLALAHGGGEDVKQVAGALSTCSRRRGSSASTRRASLRPHAPRCRGPRAGRGKGRPSCPRSAKSCEPGTAGRAGSCDPPWSK